jgi:hypothetical protein
LNDSDWLTEDRVILPTLDLLLLSHGMQRQSGGSRDLSHIVPTP